MIAAMTRMETNMATRCWDAVRDARARINRLHPLIAEPENGGPDTGTIGRHAPESSEPWGKQAAGAYFDLYFGAREYARAMRGAARMRRPADVCGHDALDIVDAMVTISQPFVLRGVTRGLERLVRQADQVPGIDESEPWVALPAMPGQVPLACPYCKTYGLRMLKRKGEVKCFFPGCTDSDGSPTRARLEPGRMTGEERLIFGDGIMMGGAA
jgi:hypothetical protein